MRPRKGRRKSALRVSQSCPADQPSVSPWVPCRMDLAPCTPLYRAALDTSSCRAHLRATRLGLSTRQPPLSVMRVGGLTVTTLDRRLPHE